MLKRPCQCQTSPRLLEGASAESRMNFYRCDTCGHVWTIPKNDPDGPIHIVTVDAPTR